MNPDVTLVGDSIENPANALTMSHAAEMFAAACWFRDTKGLAESGAFSGNLPTIASSEIPALHSRIIACDNLPNAKDIYGFEARSGFALLVGNERRGLSHEFIRIATDRVQVPMLSRRINCLNVAAASAVALFYLTRAPVGPMAVRKDPASRRPDLLLYQPRDHFELGSTIRSVAAFGWERAFIEDVYKAWFGCNRAVRSEGRGAARRGRNELLLIPCPSETSYAYPRVTVVTREAVGATLTRLNLAQGPTQLVVIPDETHGAFSPETWTRLGRSMEFVHLPLPTKDFIYHYRLIASIALAEISRQVGRRPSFRPIPAPQGPIYDRALEKLAEADGELVGFDVLKQY